MAGQQRNTQKPVGAGEETKQEAAPAAAQTMQFEILRGIHQGKDGRTYGPTGSGYPHVVTDTADLEKSQGSDKFKRLGGHVTASPVMPTLAELRAEEEAKQAAAAAAAQPQTEHGDE